MAFRMKGFPYHDDIRKEQDPDGWALSHRADGTARSGFETKKIQEAISEGMTLQEAIEAVEKRTKETKENL